jgi:ribonuclease P protein component
MLPKRYRLRRSADLEKVRQSGRSWRHPLAILAVGENGLDVSRFAFIASRRVGNAVQRNRAKRLLREAVHQHLPEIKPGWDCIFIARAPLPQAAFADVDTAVHQLLRRAKLLKGTERTGEGN